MKNWLITLLTVVSVLFVAAQQKELSPLVKKLELTAAVIDQRQHYVLQDCDSLVDIYQNKVYKCWRYYFTDSTKKEIGKIEISFNGRTEIVYYYIENRVIKKWSCEIIHGIQRHVRSEYFADDKSVYTSGYTNGIGANEVETAYVHLRSAFEFSAKN